MTLQQKIEAKKNVSVLETKEEVKIFEVPIEHTVPLENIIQQDEVIYNDLKDIIDEEIEKLKIEEFESKTNKEVLEELVNYDFIEETLKEDEEIIKENKTIDFSSDNLKFIGMQYKLLQKANEVISLKSEQSKQIIDLAVLVIDNTKENHKLSTRQDKLALMWTGTGVVIGGVLVYMFPEYLPYLQDGWNFLFNKGS